MSAFADVELQGALSVIAVDFGVLSLRASERILNCKTTPQLFLLAVLILDHWPHICEYNVVVFN